MNNRQQVVLASLSLKPLPIDNRSVAAAEPLERDWLSSNYQNIPTIFFLGGMHNRMLSSNLRGGRSHNCRKPVGMLGVGHRFFTLLTLIKWPGTDNFSLSLQIIIVNIAFSGCLLHRPKTKLKDGSIEKPRGIYVLQMQRTPGFVCFNAWQNVDKKGLLLLFSLDDRIFASGNSARRHNFRFKLF